MRARRQPPEWYVISLRPSGGHAALRRAAARHGAGLIALSPWRLRTRTDASTRAALDAALGAPRVLFASPAAVRAATALQPLHDVGDRQWYAVGAGTAAALRRAGVPSVRSPSRMDSEGVLALPELQEVAGDTVGLVTAPGGRDLIAPTLRARGARVLRADVYVREPATPSPHAIATLADLEAPAVLALSSGQALMRLLAVLAPEPRARFRRCAVVAASARLAELARAQDFADVVLAAGPQPRQLVEAAAASVSMHPSP